MEIPVYIDGKAAGALRWRREGLYTVFETLLPPGEGLARLWVTGGGQSACLGLLEPGPEGLRLRRRFSALAMREFPASPEYALLHEPEPPEPEEEPAPVEEPSTEEPAQEAGPVPEEQPAPEAESSPVEQPASQEEPVPEEETVPEEQPVPEEEPEQDGLLWYARPDGCLTAFDGKSSLLALPAELRRREPGARLTRVNGREYMVFRT